MSGTVIEPMSEPARRLEIFTGAGRRRTWSAEQKAAIVAESVGGSESVSAVARRHGLTPPQLFAWRRQARGQSVMAKERLSFASVVVNSAAIEIEYGGAVIRVPAGSDAATVRAVLQAVKAMA
jgi:transposase